ncbi:glycosyltransferase [Paenibacillus sp. HWE-109]|uniref:glycosyltransferase n=1 Tax=Paenibacillus sp. HWE-109 TaxID=1306526 RepID=UPI001EDD69AD|nr:glycosyltransferase [Paenibacillus sp. HWE-109]UKS24990.1 glycosyltransferase [Paenibacillus sp. HWE-109]
MKKQLFRYLYKAASVLKPVLTRFLPARIIHYGKSILLKSAQPAMKNKEKLISTQASKGINLLGYARAEMGVGESCRLAANSINAAGIPFGIINFSGTSSSRMSDLTWASQEIEDPKYDVNVFHINAEQMPEINLLYGSSLFENRYNIGFWHWELPDFPDEWQENFKYVDEIWVPSTFVQNSISIKSPVPVIKIPHSIEVRITDYRSRSYYNLPSDSFLFLTMYDLMSLKERKNPNASIDAFKKAFGPEDMDVGLVIKVNGFVSDSEEMKSLNEMILDYKNIYLIIQTISRNDINALIKSCDCFISLHRSEGFGLGFAEAMFLGKPAIGTNWSSNTDFMNGKNSCLVDYELVQLGNDYGPYKAYQYWAEPNIQHASEYMLRLVNDSEYYNGIAQEGELFIKKFHSPSNIGDLIQKRLDHIYKWKFGG